MIDQRRDTIFIVGFPRSGTTLMRDLLNDHPSVAIGPESHFFNRWLPAARAKGSSAFAELLEHRYLRHLDVQHPYARPGRQVDDASARSFFSSLLDAIAADAGAEIAGDKTPVHYRHLDTIRSWYPDARVIFMIRDPRAVAASLQFIDRAWTNRPLEEHLTGWLDAAARARVNEFDPNTRLVRYEDLVDDHHAVLEDLFGWLELAPPTDEVAAREPSTIIEHGQLAPSMAVSNAHVEAWRTRLASRDVEYVEWRVGHAMASFGYARTTQPSSTRKLTHRARRLGMQARSILDRSLVKVRRRLGRT